MGIFGVKSRNKRIEYRGFLGNFLPSPTQETITHAKKKTTLHKKRSSRSLDGSG